MVFQAPVESLRPPILNPDLMLGEGEGSLQATSGKGIVLQAFSTPTCVKGMGITQRARDPSNAGAATFQQKPDSSPEGQPPGGMSGVDTQESSPARGSSPELGPRPTCSVAESAVEKGGRNCNPHPIPAATSGKDVGGCSGTS